MRTGKNKSKVFLQNTEKHTNNKEAAMDKVQIVKCRQPTDEQAIKLARLRLSLLKLCKIVRKHRKLEGGV